MSTQQHGPEPVPDTTPLTACDMNRMLYGIGRDECAPEMTAEPLSEYDSLWNRWMALGNLQGNRVAARIFAALYGSSVNNTDIRARDFYAVARVYIEQEEERQAREVAV